MAEATSLERFAERDRMVHGSARLQECDRFGQDPFCRDEPHLIGRELAKQHARSGVVLVARVAQRNPCAGIDEDCAKRAHLRRFDRLGAP